MSKHSSIKVWRKFTSRYRLLGNQCSDCKSKFYPAVGLCEKCQSENLVAYEFQNKGKLISWSKITAAPKGYEEFTPYLVGIVELEDGERITSQIVDAQESDLKYGMDVETVFRKYFEDGADGIIHYGLKFKPL